MGIREMVMRYYKGTNHHEVTNARRFLEFHSMPSSSRRYYERRNRENSNPYCVTLDGCPLFAVQQHPDTMFLFSRVFDATPGMQQLRAAITKFSGDYLPWLRLDDEPSGKPFGYSLTIPDNDKWLYKIEPLLPNGDEEYVDQVYSRDMVQAGISSFLPSDSSGSTLTEQLLDHYTFFSTPTSVYWSQGIDQGIDWSDE
jgi:hypothetical protein